MSLLVLDLFAGTGSSTQAFEDRGHRVVRVERDTRHPAELHANIAHVTAEYLEHVCGGRPDFIWASPPCTTFSIASVSHHWRKIGEEFVPRNAQAGLALLLVKHTLRLIDALAPSYWLLENPRGMLRKMPMMADYTRRTVTYCQYGDSRMKPTDLWGVMPSTWTPRPMCRPRATCHTAAPRGAKTGTQGLRGAVDRSRVPYGLSQEVADHVCAALDRRQVGP